MDSYSGNTKLRVKNVTKIFGKNPKQAIKLLNEGESKDEILEKSGLTVGVNNANFEVNQGEIFVIMGLSGSGKSTLVRMLNRLIDPTIGEIYIDGQDITKMNKEDLKNTRRKKISMVFQRFGLFPHRSVLKNIEFGLEVQGLDKKSRKETAIKSLELVGLSGYENSFPHQLSGGMQQRVGLARALANDPDILLMDEAFSALDPLIRKDMQEELLNLQATMNKTIIFITHDLDEALRIGDRIALMKDGSIVQIGEPEDILLNPSNEFVSSFLKDIDLSKVLTASNIMTAPLSMDIRKDIKNAISLMESNELSTIFITNKKKELIGALTLEGAKSALKIGKKLDDAIVRNVESVSEETLIVDLLGKAFYTKIPLAVLDDTRKLKGVILNRSIIGAMSGNKDLINRSSNFNDKNEISSKAEVI
ncbi:glycine betaine/L-proline ABC transporter ATP-binding protein [Anaerobacillus sp. MEB173]|uniref:quaternary amine ABC transporter ATP-binding protein n=1 Tax=Anaerobacillus sp. MEB173 TaxID=3383345 RepID=UPI003F8E02E1